MNARVLLVALLVLSTVGFVVGVSVEKSYGGEAQSGEGAESAAQHADEAAGGEEAHTGPGSGETHEEPGADAKLLGVDLEATPFVALAAALALALAVAVWLRPSCGVLLAVVAVAMVVFAVVDVREVFHQLDEDKGGLAVLAALVAALHLAAAAVALTMGRSTLGSREAPA